MYWVIFNINKNTGRRRYIRFNKVNNFVNGKPVIFLYIYNLLVFGRVGQFESQRCFDENEHSPALHSNCILPAFPLHSQSILPLFPLHSSCILLPLTHQRSQCFSLQRKCALTGPWPSIFLSAKWSHLHESRHRQRFNLIIELVVFFWSTISSCETWK